MDTVTKGNTFEDLVFEKISGLLKNDQLGLSPSFAKIFRKKAYYSQSRKADIIVDISIEVWAPNATNYSLLWVYECKNYAGTIPVNDVEEFKAKLDQIAGKNIKGVVASRNALQRGALEFARSNGIGVIRILPDNQVKNIHFLMSVADYNESKIKDITNGLTDQNHISPNRSLMVSWESFLFDDWRSFLGYSLKL